MRVHFVHAYDITVNVSTLRRTEVVLGRVTATLYGYLGAWKQHRDRVDRGFTSGWVQVLCNIFDATPPEQGPAQHRYLAKDLEHAILYHFHSTRGHRLRFYKAQINDNGDAVIDDGENAIHATTNNVNGQPRPLMRSFAMSSSWYIILDVGDSPATIAIKCCYEPRST